MFIAPLSSLVPSPFSFTLVFAALHGTFYFTEVTPTTFLLFLLFAFRSSWHCEGSRSGARNLPRRLIAFFLPQLSKHCVSSRSGALHLLRRWVASFFTKCRNTAFVPDPGPYACSAVRRINFFLCRRSNTFVPDSGPYARSAVSRIDFCPFSFVVLLLLLLRSNVLLVSYHC